MKPPKKYSKKKENQTTQQLNTFTILIDNSVTADNNENIIESLENIKSDNAGNFEIIVLDNGENTDLVEKIRSVLSNGAACKSIEIKSAPVNQLLYKCIEESNKEYIIVIHSNSLQDNLNFNQLSSLRLDKNNIGIANYQEKIKKKKTSAKEELLIYPKEIALYIFKNSGQNYRSESDYIRKRLKIKTSSIGLSQPNPFVEKKKRNIPFQFLTLYFKWNYLIPIREFKEKPHTRYAFIKDSSLYRTAFHSIAIFLFFLLPIMGYDAGISGDEPGFSYPESEKVLKFYTTMGKDTSFAVRKNQKYYGISFDTITTAIIKVFKIDKIYETRHVFNSLVGWMAILVIGLFAMRLGGYRAGIIAMLLLFFSPRFLGHSFNNPKDLPFAMAYIFTIYFIVKFLKEFPKPSNRTIFLTAFGIAMAISVRIGGLLLVAYLFLFSGIYFLFTNKISKLFSSNNLIRLRKLIGLLLVISLLGYFMGILLWPYAIQNPIKNPLKALKVMTSFGTSIRQLFEGKIYWSNALPWYYIPKYILISTPLVSLVGLLFYLLFIGKKKEKLSYLWKFIVVFAFFFPVFYIVYKKSNVYGGWRHALFAYPPMVLAGALGFNYLIEYSKNKIYRVAIILILLGLSVKPVIHTFQNHPHQYIYYNEFVGDVKKAYGKYETDYYYHSIKKASEWLLNHINTDTISPDNKIIVATNHYQITEYYFRNHTDKIQLVYVRYYERGNTDWDYAIIVNSYINAYQLKKHIWPPKYNTIHTIDVDGKAVCAVLKRKNKFDYLGYEALKKNDYPTGIAYLSRAIEEDPGNEAAILNLAQAMINLRHYPQAIEILSKCHKVYPNYDRALNLLGVTYLNMGNLQKALEVFNQITKVNYKYYTAYYNMAIVYARMNDIDNAMRYAQETMKYNSRYKPAYYFMADLLKRKGMNAEAERYLQAANSLK